MPRTVTTMFGLVLIVVSIGFNTAHWPIVWQGVGSAMERASSVEAAPRPVTLPPQPTAPPVAQPARPESPSPPPAQAGVKPVPDAEKTAGDGPSPVQANPPADSAPAVDENAAAPAMPLVPVPQIRAAAGSSVNAGLAATVRRLPPVDPSASAPAARDTASPSGSVPVYPSTGIE